ncbi:MAG: hypothetical protein QF552_08215 [Litorilituus sp.]|jgi:pimeloyl-ACP methyl ester carboxylesterase|nr:hypothetical protein [Litorilituus sp.]
MSKSTDQEPNKEPSKSNGIFNLADDAINGIADIVEQLHQSVVAKALGNSKGAKLINEITGRVIKNTRKITSFVSSGADQLLEKFGDKYQGTASSTKKDAILSALNGVVGDYLVDRDNSLAIKMQFRLHGKSLSTNELLAIAQNGGGKLIIMVHGLCMNDRQWQRNEHDHGAELAKELGCGLIYLHYNTGRHISENGQCFDELMTSFIKDISSEIDVFVIAHSMGGLVTRSAFYYAQQLNHNWLNCVSKVIFLGSPHHGAPLEKGGNWIDFLLSTNSHSSAFTKLTQIRSNGITDLRYGNIIAQDWQQSEKFVLSRDQRLPTPLPENVLCFAVATISSKVANIVTKSVLGDGLVPLNSALGHHKDKQFDLNIPEDRKWIGKNINHLDMLSDLTVYKTITAWIK